MNNSALLVLIVIVIVLLVGLFMADNMKEYFGQMKGDKKKVLSSALLNRYYDGYSDKGIEPYLFDKAPCSPDCCASAWQVSYDGLDPQQLEAALIMNSELPASGEYVMNNYTCTSSGAGQFSKAGCPCIKKDAAQFLANRGNNTISIDPISSLFMIPGPSSTVEDEVIVDTSPANFGGGYGIRKLDNMDFSQSTTQKIQNLYASLPSKEEQIYEMVYT